MRTVLKNKKKYVYHISHNYLINDKKVNVLTQLYNIGVYYAAYEEGNSVPVLQASLKLSQLVKIEKKLKKDLENNIITDLNFGREITVIENDEGFYEELKESYDKNNSNIEKLILQVQNFLIKFNLLNK